ncbi:unnamed protein product [Closterium sp. NIES-53]
MEVARTSMIHAAAPHFLWPFAVWYARHQLNLWPRVSLPETSPTLRWTGKVGDASVFRFYHPTSCRVLPSQDVTFDESVPFYRLFPYRSAPPPPPLLFLAPGPPPVDPLPPQGPAPSGVSQVDPLPGTAPVQVAVVSDAAPGAASGGAASRGATSGGAELGGAGSEGAGSGGAEPEGVEPGGAELEGAEPGGAESERAESGGAEPRAGEPRDTGAGGAAVSPGAGDPTEPGAAGAGGAGAGVAGVGGTSAGGAGAVGAGAVDPGAVDPGAGGAGGIVRLYPYFIPLLQQPTLQPASPLPAPSPYTENSGGLTERREPASRPISPVRTARRAPRSRPPPKVPDPESDRVRAASPTVACLLATAASALVAESVPASPPSVGGECALGTDVLEDRQEDFECLAAAVPRFASLLLAPEGDPDAPDIPTPRSYVEAITCPYSSQWQAAMDAEMASWKSTGTYVDEVPPPRANIVNGMWIFRVKRPPGSPPSFKARYFARGFSQQQGVDYFQTFSPTPKMTTLWVLLHIAAQCDYELHSLDFSTSFLQGSLHEEIWLRRPPGFIGTFPAGNQWSLRRPVYGLCQAPREWHDTLRTTLAALGFAPSTADPSLFLRTDTSLPPFYVLVYVDDLVFATADTEAPTLVKSKLQKRHTCNDLGELRIYLGLQITRDRERCTITLTQSHMVHQSVEPSGLYPELVGWLITSGMRLVLGGWGPVVLTGHADNSWFDDSATQRSSQGYTFSLGSGSVSWRSTRSSSVLSSSCEAEIYAEAMAAQELRWLTYLLTDLGEQPHSPPVLYVDNKAMIALCQEHRLEHRTKHIALRYFLARELQQRGQLRLAYVASQANTADVFTKALPPGDHQRFVPVLGLGLTVSERKVSGSNPSVCTSGIPVRAGVREQVLFYDRYFLGPTTERCPTSRVALPCLSRRPVLPIASPCLLSRRPAYCRVALPCQSRCPASRRVALLPARRIAACASPCPARAEPHCCPHCPVARLPAARAPPCWQPHRCPHRPARDALLYAPLLAGALLPAQPCYAPLCCSHHPAAARPATRSPAGRRPTGSRTAARAALLLLALLCAALLAAALPCPGCAPLFPSRAPPLPALRASLVLACRPA